MNKKVFPTFISFVVLLVESICPSEGNSGLVSRKTNFETTKDFSTNRAGTAISLNLPKKNFPDPKGWVPTEVQHYSQMCGAASRIDQHFVVGSSLTHAISNGSNTRRTTLADAPICFNSS